MKKLLILTFFLSIFLAPISKSFSQTTMAPGDMAFIGFNTSGTDGVSFVTFVNLCPGTVFFFTDNPYRNSGGFCTSTEEFCVRFVVTTTIPAGTKITYTDANYPTVGSVGLSPAVGAATPSYSYTGTAGTNNGFNSGGDNCFIFQGSYTTPSFVCAFKNSGTYNLAGTVSCNDRDHTELPSSLTLGVNAMVGCVNVGMRYLCTTLTGNAATLGASINNIANWTCSGSAVTLPPTCAFTVTGVTNPLPVVTATASPTTICNGSTVTLNASGTTSYTWSSNAGGVTTTTAAVTPTTNTTYTITGNVLGCTDTETIAVTVNPIPTLTLSATSATICNGQNNVLTATGATSYTWSANAGGVTTTTAAVTPTSTTIYTVTGNSLGCVSTRTISVNVNALPVLTLTANSPTICSGQTSTLTASGATNYTWNPTSATGSSIVPSPSVTTNYTVIGLNSVTGCTNTNTFNLTVNTTPTITATSVGSSTICSGTTSTLTASGANTYVWNPGASSSATINPTPNSTTIYTVVGTNTLGGCTDTKTVGITVNTTPTLSIPSNSIALCTGNTLILPTASGGSSINWSGPNSFISSVASPTVSTSAGTIQAGVYNVFVSNTVGSQTCSSAVSQVTVSITTSAAINVSNSALCLGSSTTIVPSGGVSYTLIPSAITGTSFTLNPTTATNYTVLGVTGTGCNGSTTFSINVNTLPVLSVSNQTTCAGSPITLTASNANTYTWLPSGAITNTLSVNPTTPSTYSVIGTNNLTGCSSTLNVVSVAVNGLPNVVASANPNSICPTGTVNLTATSANTYTWSLGNGVTASNQNQSSITFSASGLTSGTYIYTVTATDANNCTSLPTTSTLTVIALPNANFDLSDLSLCQNSTGSISINNPQTGVTYNWNIGGQSFTNTNPLQIPSSITGNVGTVTVSVVSSILTCTNTANNTLTITTLPSVSLISTTASACENTAVQLDVASPNSAYTYAWFYNSQNVSNSSNLSINPITSANVGTYTVTVTNSNGCENRTTGDINILECETLIPELFTPNGDTKNETFLIKYIENYPNNKLAIYNRWGNVIYQKDGYSNEFAGYSNTGTAIGNEKLPAGTYYVILDYGDGKTKKYSGVLLLQY